MPSPDSPRYLLGKRRIQETYDAGRSAADYAEVLEKTRERNARDRATFDETLNRRNNAWAAPRRGMHSWGGGQMRQNQTADEQWRRNWQDHYLQNQQRVQQIELQRQQLLRDRDYSLQDLELQETERRMQPEPAAAAVTSPMIIPPDFGSFGGDVVGVNSQGNPIYAGPAVEEPAAATQNNPYYPYKDWNDWARANGYR